MRHVSFLIFGLMLCMVIPWVGIHLKVKSQFGLLSETTTNLQPDGSNIPDEPLYPPQRAGRFYQGKAVFGKSGCVSCHTQQVRASLDLKRNWGKRQSVARDYINQDIPLLGSLRIGPDLSNYSLRVNKELSDKTQDNWLHLLIYNSRIIYPKSLMPAHPHLYEKVKERFAGEIALQFPPDSKHAPSEGFAIIPTTDAKNLVYYIKNLNQNYELPEILFVNSKQSSE